MVGLDLEMCAADHGGSTREACSMGAGKIARVVQGGA